MPDAAELFQAVIEEHRRRPRHRGPLPTAQRVARRENPACGDVCTLHFRLEPAPSPSGETPASPTPLAPGTRVAEASFTGAGCALSQASASLATATLAGCGTAEALELIERLERLVRLGAAPGDDAACGLGEAAALSAVHSFPARHACTLLAWSAARDALSA